MIRRILPLLLLGVIPCGLRGIGGKQATADEPRATTQTAARPDDRAVAALIRQLGDDDYKRREEATEKLMAVGEAARPMLVATLGEKNLDPEIADRIAAILPHLGRIPGHSFNSELALEVWVQEHWDSGSPTVGTTPAAPALAIPECDSWGIMPLPGWNQDWAALVRLINQERIPEFRGPADARDADLAHLTELQGLRALNLVGTKVTDAGLAQLKNIKGLTALNLHGIALTDAGLARLKELKGLRWLDLQDTKITDTGLAHLQQLKGLENLYLAQTNVTDAGKDALRQALPNLKIDGH